MRYKPVRPNGPWVRMALSETIKRDAEQCQFHTGKYWWFRVKDDTNKWIYYYAKAGGYNWIEVWSKLEKIWKVK